MGREVPSAYWGIGLATILVTGGALVLFKWETKSDPSTLLAAAILLACFCGVLGQKRSSRVSDDVVSTLLLGGLGLGGVIGVEPFNRIFMIGLLGYAGFFLARHMAASIQKTLALVYGGKRFPCGSAFSVDHLFTVGSFSSALSRNHPVFPGIARWGLGRGLAGFWTVPA